MKLFMKRWTAIAASLVLLIFVTAGCTSSAGQAPSQNPTGSAAPQVTAPPENQAELYTLAGKPAEIQVSGKKVPGSGYYQGKGEENLILPFVEVCKGLGWMVIEPEGAGSTEIKMTKSDAEEIVIAYTRPQNEFATDVGTIRIQKAGKDVPVHEMKALPFIDGMLYANEGFISEAVEKITVKYDGETLISVEPSA